MIVKFANDFRVAGLRRKRFPKGVVHDVPDSMKDMLPKSAEILPDDYVEIEVETQTEIETLSQLAKSRSGYSKEDMNEAKKAADEANKAADEAEAAEDVANKKLEETQAELNAIKASLGTPVDPVEPKVAKKSAVSKAKK